MPPRPTSAVSHAFEDHTGELRLRVDAPALAELFAEAGRALARLACGDRPPPSPEGEAQPVSLRSRDRAALLVDWLNDLIFHTEVEARRPAAPVGRRARSAAQRGRALAPPGARHR